MRPLLRDGSVVPMFPAEGRVGPGDLVFYSNGSGSHLHRVWWRRGDALWIKDDTGSVSLQKVSLSRVTGVCREGGALGRGFVGLAFSLACTAAFAAGRAIRRSGVRRFTRISRVDVRDR